MYICMYVHGSCFETAADTDSEDIPLFFVPLQRFLFCLFLMSPDIAERVLRQRQFVVGIALNLESAMRYDKKAHLLTVAINKLLGVR